jgi:Ca2+/Na+ antiporter
MSEAPLAPDCRHCGATNDSDAAACWQCHRRDWRPPPEPQPSPRVQHDPHSMYVGCMVIIAITMIAIVVRAFEVGRIVGLVVLILAVVGYALAIALFMVCMVVSKI